MLLICRYFWLSLFFSYLPLPAHAAGIVPTSSLVIVEEDEKEGSITVTNTDADPSLLFVTIENLPEDQENLLIVTPPVIRVESRSQQLVRFLLSSQKPLTTERLRRVTFEGIPAVKSQDSGKIQITYQQNLPVLIRPKGLARETEPWTHLQWSLKGNQAVELSNNSPYVVRFSSNQATLLPGKIGVTLPKFYILPGEKLTARPNKGANTLGASEIKISPATSYGYRTDEYIAKLTLK
ncbi:MAG: fimbria/pilus chaperone family protein [Enterobacteriaceae bacterium]